jgi:hypothetical protein
MLTCFSLLLLALQSYHPSFLSNCDFPSVCFFLQISCCIPMQLYISQDHNRYVCTFLLGTRWPTWPKAIFRHIIATVRPKVVGTHCWNNGSQFCCKFCISGNRNCWNTIQVRERRSLLEHMVARVRTVYYTGPQQWIFLVCKLSHKSGEEIPICSYHCKIPYGLGWPGLWNGKTGHFRFLSVKEDKMGTWIVKESTAFVVHMYMRTWMY